MHMQHNVGYWLKVAAFGAALCSAAALASAGEAFLPFAINSSTMPANGDVNPYGVAFVPDGFPGGGMLAAGDVLVSNFNNAGNLRDIIFHKMSEEEFDSVIRVHLKGSWNVSRAAARPYSCASLMLRSARSTKSLRPRRSLLLLRADGFRQLGFNGRHAGGDLVKCEGDLGLLRSEHVP